MAFSAPIHVLPPETLSEIFLCCLPPDDFLAISNRHAPLVLTLVCRYWRDVAVNTPQLWSSLRVHDKLPSEAFPLIDTWLSRSADRPLSLGLMLYDYSERRRPIVQGLLNRLVAHASRWHEVHLQLPRQTYAILFKRLKRLQYKRKNGESPPQLPFLETLTIQTSNDTANGVGEMLCSMLRAAPRLRSLFWADFGCTSCIIDVLPQSAGLVELLLDMNLTVNQALQILTHCPQLRECAFGALRLCDTAPPPISDPIELPELTSLTLLTCQDLGLLFDYITLPGLRSLSLQYGDNVEGHAVSPRWPLGEFSAMLWRSRSPLETLKFTSFSLSEWAFIDSLRPIESTLKYLRLCFAVPTVKDALLDMWTCPPPKEDGSMPDYFCPKLEKLELYDCLGASCGKLANMVVSRAKRDRPQKVLPLSSVVGTGVHMGDIRLLRNLEREGVLVPGLHMDLRSF